MNTYEIKFIKPINYKDHNKKDDDKARLYFSEISEHCLELASRCIIIRSHIIKFNNNFARDAKRAKRWFIGTTGAVMTFTLCSFIMVAYIGQDGGYENYVIIFGIVVGILIAASKAFGFNLQFKTLFQARWALVALRIDVDQQLHLLALDIKKGERLNEDTRNKLDNLVEEWTDQLKIILNNFGSHYGDSYSIFDIKGILKKEL